MSIQREIIFKADDSQFSSIVDRIGKTITEAFSTAGAEVEKTNKRMNDLSGSIKTEMDKIQNSGKAAFTEMLRGSEKYGNNIKERLGYLQRELQIQQQLLREETARLQLSAKLRYEAERRTLSDFGGGEAQFRELDDNYSEERTNIDANAKIKELRLKAAQNEYSQYRANELERKADEDATKKSKDKGGNGFINAVGTGFNAAAGAAGFGAILSIAGFIGKAIGEGEELARARTGVQGMSQSMGTYGVGRMYDLKTADVLKYSEDLAHSSGSIRGLGIRARRQYEFEKSYSLNPGELNQGAVALRMDGAHRSSAQVALEMLNFFKQSKVFGIEKGDFTRVSELLGISNELNAQQVEQSGRVDPTQTMKMLAMFGRLGIDSSRATSYESGINAGIRSPTDEFSGAVIMRALSKSHPEMSLFQIQEQQAKGAFGGNLNAVMKEFGNTSSGELLMKTVQSAFKLEPSQARVLVEGYQKNNRIFEGEEGDNNIKRLISTGQVAGRAGANTTTLQGLLAQFNDKFAGWGTSMIGEIKKITDAYEKDGVLGVIKQGYKDIVNAIIDGFKHAEAANSPFSTGQARTEAAVEDFNYVKDRKIGTNSLSIGKRGSTIPGRKGIAYTIMRAPELRNLFDGGDKETFMFDKQDYLKNIDYGANFGVRGEKKAVEGVLANATPAEMQKVIGNLETNWAKYFPELAAKGVKKGDEDSGVMTVRILQDMLTEIRKSNNTTQHRKNTVHTKTK